MLLGANQASEMGGFELDIHTDCDLSRVEKHVYESDLQIEVIRARSTGGITTCKSSSGSHLDLLSE